MSATFGLSASCPGKPGIGTARWRGLDGRPVRGFPASVDFDEQPATAERADVSACDHLGRMARDALPVALAGSGAGPEDILGAARRQGDYLVERAVISFDKAAS
jgi:hypothetical protein